MNKEYNARSLMADAKFYEAYARYDGEKKRYETWEEAVDRVMDMHKRFYKDKISERLLNYMGFAEERYKQKKVLGAQRVLQFGGDQLLSHHIRNYNCVSSHCDRAAFFGEFMYMLLCGAGAGFSVQKHHVEMLPNITQRKNKAVTYKIPDSIEGWAESVDVLMSSFFEDGGKHPKYKGCHVSFDYSDIRPKGAFISGGFKAPGPEPLRKALGLIEDLLNKAVKEGNKLRPIHCYDICMYAADAVIAGGVNGKSGPLQ